MSIKIVNVDQMDNGVLVNFEDGVRSLFDSAFLYEQVDKRIEADSDDGSSAHPLLQGS
jgi:hypothetical protein